MATVDMRLTGIPDQLTSMAKDSRDAASRCAALLEQLKRDLDSLGKTPEQATHAVEQPAQPEEKAAQPDENNAAAPDENAAAPEVGGDDEEPIVLSKAEAEAQEMKEKLEHVRKTGVQESLVKRLLRKEGDEMAACFHLPEILAFFLITSGTALAHFEFEYLFATDKAITFDIEENANFAFSGNVPYQAGRMGHKGIYDVNGIADFWSWMSMGIAGLWFPDPSSTDWGFSEVEGNIGAMCTAPMDALAGWAFPDVTGTSATYDQGYCPTFHSNINLDSDIQSLKIYSVDGSSTDFVPTYLYFNSIVGGVRMRQERLDIIDCPENPEIENHAHVGKCTEYDYNLYPEKYQAIWTTDELTNHPSNEDKFIKSRTPTGDVIQQFRQLEREGWFNPLTNKIEILFTTYNAHQGMFTAVFVHFFLTRGGHIHKHVAPVSIWLDPYHGNYGIYVLDFLWLFLVGKIFVEEGCDLINHWRQLGVVRGTREYMTIYNAVDWVNISFSIAIVAMWAAHLSRLGELNDMLRKADPTIQGSWESQSELEDYFTHVHHMIENAYSFRVVVALYQFLIAVRFFKEFDAQPRLSLVTQTIAEALVGIIHFGVVFLTIFFIFMLSAMLLFGQELMYFTNVGRASMSTFRVVLGDFDWDELLVIGRPQAIIWFWSIIFILNILMLNMFLGIILDTYSEVKTRIMEQPGVETLWSQAAEIFNRKKKVFSGVNVSLPRILKILDPTDLDSDDEGGEDPLLTVQSFMDKIPGMREEQAEELLLTAHEYFGNEDIVEEAPLEQLARKLEKLDDRLDAALADLPAMSIPQSFVC